MNAVIFVREGRGEDGERRRGKGGGRGGGERGDTSWLAHLSAQGNVMLAEVG